MSEGSAVVVLGFSVIAETGPVICIHKLGHFVTWLHRLNSSNNLPPKAILLEYLKKISHGIGKGIYFAVGME